MSPAVSTILLLYLPGCLLVLVGAHVLVSRLHAARRPSPSPQRSLAALILAMNLPVLAGVWAIAWHEQRPPAGLAAMLLFSGIVYNGFAYAYFHVFNMSETARRVRILLFVLANPGMPIVSLHGEYSPRRMVAARIARLTQMRQIEKGADNRLRITGRLLLTAARPIAAWRAMLGFGR